MRNCKLVTDHTCRHLTVITSMSSSTCCTQLPWMPLRRRLFSMSPSCCYQRIHVFQLPYTRHVTPWRQSVVEKPNTLLNLIVTMLSRVHTVVDSVEGNSGTLLTDVNELRAALQHRPPDAREAWNWLCLLWRAVAQVADNMCANAAARERKQSCSLQRFTFDQWLSMHTTASDLLRWASEHEDCSEENGASSPLIAMQAQLQIFDAEVTSLERRAVRSGVHPESDTRKMYRCTRARAHGRAHGKRCKILAQQRRN